MAAFGDADQRGRILKGDQDDLKAEEAAWSNSVMAGYLAVLSQLHGKSFSDFLSKP